MIQTDNVTIEAKKEKGIVIFCELPKLHLTQHWRLYHSGNSLSLYLILSTMAQLFANEKCYVKLQAGKRRNRGG